MEPSSDIAKKKQTQLFTAMSETDSIFQRLEEAAAEFVSDALQRHPRFGYPHDVTAGVVVSLLATRIRQRGEMQQFDEYVRSRPDFRSYWARDDVVIAEVVSDQFFIGSSLADNLGRVGEFVLWHAINHVDLGSSACTPLIVDYLATHFERQGIWPSMVLAFDEIHEVLHSESCRHWDFQNTARYHGSAQDRQLMSNLHRIRLSELSTATSTVTMLATSYVRHAIDDFAENLMINSVTALAFLEHPIVKAWDKHSLLVK